MRTLVCFLVLAMVVSSAHAYNYYWQTKIDGKGLVAFDATFVIPKVPTKNIQAKVGLYPSTAPVSQEHHPLVHMLESNPASLAEEDVELQAKTTAPAKAPAAKGGKAGASADNWAPADTTNAPDPGTPLPGSSSADGSQEAIECVISEASQTNKKTKAKRRAFTSNCSPGTKVLQGKAQTPKGSSFNGAQAIRVQAYLKSRSGTKQTWATLNAPQGGANDAGTFDVKGAPQFNIFKITVISPDSVWGKTTAIHLEKLTLEYEAGAAATAEKAFCPSSATELKKHGSSKLVVTAQGNPRVQKVARSQTRLNTKSCVINKMSLTTPGGMKSGENDTEDAQADELVDWEATAQFVEEQEAADMAALDAESSSSGGSAVGVVVGALAAVGVVAGAGAYLYLKKRKAAVAGATPTEGARPEGGKKEKANVKHARLEETTTPRAAHSAVMPR